MATRYVSRTAPIIDRSSLPFPRGAERHFVLTPDGVLEVVHADPTSKDGPSQQRAPIIFLHGGFGSAHCYENFLPWFAERGYPCYAVSLRGHGNSWYPGYWSMMWTRKAAFASDLQAVVNWVGGRHPGLCPLLVGHSAGGGLSQDSLDRGLFDVRALVLISAFPNFGGWGVYLNWMKIDCWMFIRVLWDLYHPRSVLSDTRLVRSAFFSEECPNETVVATEKAMSPYESLLWPSAMMFPFVKCFRVLRHIISPPSVRPKPKILVIAGEEDKLMGVKLMRQIAADYRAALANHEDENAGGVQFDVIEKSGHHVMLDCHWEKCAERVLRFAKEVDA